MSEGQQSNGPASVPVNLMKAGCGIIVAVLGFVLSVIILFIGLAALGVFGK